MDPFATRKPNRTDWRKPVLLLLATASFSIWYFDLAPSLETVATGNLGQDLSDPDLTADDFIAMLESTPDKDLHDHHSPDDVMNMNEQSEFADLAEPAVLSEDTFPEFATAEEPAAPPVPSGIQQASFEQSALPEMPPRPQEMVLSADVANHLKDVDAWIESGETLEAHAALSRMYWKKPDVRIHLQQRLEQTAAEIYANPNKHFADPYMVNFGDTLENIAQQHSVPWQYLARLNRVTPETLQAGQTIKVLKGPFGAVVDLEKRQLTLHAHGWFVRQYPVGIGKENSTPVGEFAVQEKQENPVWYNPDGGVVDADDPANPLGEYWIGLGDHIGIHGTIDPDSIGASASRGCIHMNDGDIAEVFQLLGSGSTVVIR